MKKSKNFKVRLGIFVVFGILLFLGAIYYIGKNQSLFTKSFTLKAIFNNVGGLQVGNNVRFSGISVGTIDQIQIINDTSVMVSFLMEEKVKPFIKKDANAVIGSEGLMGNKVINIIPGSANKKPVEDNDTLKSIKPLDIDDILKSVKATADNASVITGDLAVLTDNIRRGRGMVGKLFSDTVFAGNIDRTVVNLRKSTKGLDENMQAAHESFLLKPFFKKKKKKEEEEAQKLEDAKNQGKDDQETKSKKEIREENKEKKKEEKEEKKEEKQAEKEAKKEAKEENK